MSRGFVLWPDEKASDAIEQLWAELSARGIPSMSAHTHRRHRPHVSLSVAESLPVDAALEAVGMVPARPVRLLVESAGVFSAGHLFLACVPSHELLAEQRRVHQVLTPVASNPWPYFAPGNWTPHITTGWALRPREIAAALPLVLQRLPISGWLDHGGVEDGDTGQRWPCAGSITVR